MMKKSLEDIIAVSFCEGFFMGYSMIYFNVQGASIADSLIISVIISIPFLCFLSYLIYKHLKISKEKTNE